MTKPVIVVDLDDIVLDFMRAWLMFHHRQYNAPLIAWEDAWTFDFDKLHNLSVDEKNARVMAFWRSPDHAKIVALPGAIFALQKLAVVYDLVMVTARPEEVTEETMQLVNRYCPTLFREHHFVGTYHHVENKRRTKGAVCDELGAVAMIDDGFKNCVGAIKTGRKVIMPSCPWNAGHADYNVLRVNEWSETLQILKV